jgi:hypothetical protein
MTLQGDSSTFAGIPASTIRLGAFISFQLHKMWSLKKNNAPSPRKKQWDEAHPVLLLNFLHTVRQTMLSPLVFHNPLGYLAKVI